MALTSITYSRIWHVAYPIILGSVAQNLINFTDTAFLGRVGEIALGAGALGGIFYLAVIMIGLGFGTGAQIIIARRYGENELKKVGSIVDHSIVFLLVMAVICYFLLQYGAEVILKSFINSDEVFDATVAFLDYRAYGIFFAFMNVTFRSFYVGLARTKVITYTTLVLAAVNIVFDYLLIFGRFGFPEMGIEGAALASVIAEVFALLFFVAYTLATVRLKDYALYRFIGLSFEKLFRILKISVPVMMQMFLSLAVWFLFFIFIEKLGESELAVSNIIRSVFVVLLVPVWGFATATNTLVSYLIGQGKPNEVLALVMKIVLLCIGGVVIVVSFGLLFPRLLLSIYTNNAELIDMGVPVLYVISIAALFLAVGFILFNGVSGTGKTNVSLIIEVVVLTLYITYAYRAVYEFQASITIVWTTEFLYGIFLALFSYAYLRSGKWKKSRI
jgi:putative MATE family efflux protein